jgi:hypothetical protein
VLINQRRPKVIGCFCSFVWILGLSPRLPGGSTNGSAVAPYDSISSSSGSNSSNDILFILCLLTFRCGRLCLRNSGGDFFFIHWEEGLYRLKCLIQNVLISGGKSDSDHRITRSRYESAPIHEFFWFRKTFATRPVPGRRKISTGYAMRRASLSPDFVALFEIHSETESTRWIIGSNDVPITPCIKKMDPSLFATTPAVQR